MDKRKVSRSITLEQWQWDYLESLLNTNKSEWIRSAFNLKYVMEVKKPPLNE